MHQGVMPAPHMLANLWGCNAVKLQNKEFVILLNISITNIKGDYSYFNMMIKFVYPDAEKVM